jgi:protein-ribulosamine 3-kinase
VSAGARPLGRAAFLEAELRQALAEPLLELRQAEPVGGGCIHHALRLRTSKGDWFAKWNDDCAPDLFLSEAAGLRALREAGGPLRIPEVLVARERAADRPAFILMEYLAPGSGRAGDDEALGRGLAAIHARPAAGFGFPVTTYCGPTAQDNRPADSWSEFYAERRLRPLLERLVVERRLGRNERGPFDRLIERLPALVGADSSPALIHGDLWSGNVLATAFGPALVDPACAFCERELEFGITTLFGGFSERFFTAYHEALPLAAGWRERNPIYQLYHLLNHQLIFGGHYGAEALQIARRY